MIDHLADPEHTLNQLQRRFAAEGKAEEFLSFMKIMGTSMPTADQTVGDFVGLKWVGPLPPLLPGTTATGEAASSPGGIDFKSDKVDSAFSVRNSGGAIKFHIDPAMLEQLQNAPGFMPVIINIQPMDNLRLFLGLIDNQPSQETASL